MPDFFPRVCEVLSLCGGMSGFCPLQESQGLLLGPEILGATVPNSYHPESQTHLTQTVALPGRCPSGNLLPQHLTFSKAPAPGRYKGWTHWARRGIKVLQASKPCRGPQLLYSLDSRIGCVSSNTFSGTTARLLPHGRACRDLGQRQLGTCQHGSPCPGRSS